MIAARTAHACFTCDGDIGERSFPPTTLPAAAIVRPDTVQFQPFRQLGGGGRVGGWW